MVGFRKFTKFTKTTIVIAAAFFAVFLADLAIFGAHFPDNPALNFTVSENPFTVPRQETFPIVRIFEENGFHPGRIDNIQFAVQFATLPDSSKMWITNQAYIQAVWDLLSNVEVTTRNAAHAPLNYEMSIYVDFQFTNPNYSLAIEMFGQVYILGRGPFVFAEGSSAQQIVNLFADFTNIHNVHPAFAQPPQFEFAGPGTPPGVIIGGPGYTIMPPPYEYEEPEDEYPETENEYSETDNEYSETENEYSETENDYSETENDYSETITENMNDIMDSTGFLELLAANGFYYEVSVKIPAREDWLSVSAKEIRVENDIIAIFEYSSNEEMVNNSRFIQTYGFGTAYPEGNVQGSAPHWFKRDSIIVFYAGENEDIINFLGKPFGDSFAG